MFSIGQKVNYTYIKFAVIDQIHYDNAPEIYYTINIIGTDRYPQTTENNLKIIKKIGEIIPFDKGDKIVYIKNNETQIYDIKDGKEPLYKIKFNGNFKYVKGKKLNAI